MKKIIILTLLSSLLVAGLAFGQGGKNGCDGKRGDRHGKRHNGIKMILKLSDKLELTDSQTAQLKKYAVDFKLEAIDMKAEIQKEKVLMKSLMHNEDASEHEVFAKIDKISGLKADTKKLQFTHRKAIQEVLTDAQEETLKELRKSHRGAGMRGHRSNDGEGRGNRHGDRSGKMHKG